MSTASGDRVLVAGIGNVFLGDDGFGVEVVRRLRQAALADRVDIVDYGIRGMHLAYDLLDGRHQTLVLVDAVPLAEAAGTLAVLEVDVDDPGWATPPAAVLDAPGVNGHGMDPQSVLRLLHRLGGRVARVFVVGCQPAVLDEGMRLSAPVREALDDAVRTVAGVANREAALLDDADRAATGALDDRSEETARA